MSDIFISHSSYDHHNAKDLAHKLRGAGYHVWYDEHITDIDEESIRKAIEQLTNAVTIVFLISKDSVTSKRCSKEIHLANEKNKNILPILLEDTPLPILFEYPLAGLQRVPYERLDLILHALNVLDTGKTVLDAMLSQSKIYDSTVKLAVLPFEDQSPRQDNEWFANGMMDELIDTLGSLSSIKVNPKSEVVHYRKNPPKLEEIVRDLGVRYIVEGAIQKSGEKIRIHVSLTDCKEQKRIWSEKYNGTFDDIFDLQDQTCYAIADAIKLVLTPEDKQIIDRKPTEHAEAYELSMRGNYYFNRATKQDFLFSIELFEKAVERDLNYIWAWTSLANAYSEIHRNYNKNPSWLIKARKAVNTSLTLHPNNGLALCMLGKLELLSGNFENAVTAAKSGVKEIPNNAFAYHRLGFIYMEIGKCKEAAEAFEKSIELMPSNMSSYLNLSGQYHKLHDLLKCKEVAERVSPLIQKHIFRYPDDQAIRVGYAIILNNAGFVHESLQEMEKLLALPGIDGSTYFNCSSIYADNREYDRALELIERAIEKGFSRLHLIENALNSEGLKNTKGAGRIRKRLKNMKMIL